MEQLDFSPSDRINITTQNGLRILTVELLNGHKLVGRQSLGGAWRTYDLLNNRKPTHLEINEVPLILNVGATLSSEQLEFLFTDSVFLPNDDGASFNGLKKYYQDLFANIDIAASEPALSTTEIIQAALSQEIKYSNAEEINRHEKITIIVTGNNLIYFRKDGLAEKTREFVGYFDRFSIDRKIGHTISMEGVYYKDGIFCSGLLANHKLPINDLRGVMSEKEINNFLRCLQYETGAIM